MKISLEDFNIIIDTLIGSTYIQDNSAIWKYQKDARFAVASKLLNISAMVNLELELEKKSNV